jgi:site-specific DNA-methyltransferase (adenine-specific)
MTEKIKSNLKTPRTSTVSRSKAVTLDELPSVVKYEKENISIAYGDSLGFYQEWASPTVIVSDGAYGVLGFEGDTSDHLGLAEWYEPHIQAWSKKATGQTTLWFWNSEVGWASVHPILEKHGWRYVNCNTWNKGKGHIAGNVNTKTIRRFPVVTEVCVQYVFETKIDGLILKNWLLSEWRRTGLKLKEANIACEVADVAVRKYLDQGHLWYWPPVDKFVKLSEYANLNGKKDGYPYFSLDGVAPMSAEDWKKTRAKFNCPHGTTNVWERGSLKGAERLKAEGLSGRAIHLNQKPLDLMTLIVEASSDVGDVVWEPFGGTFSAAVAAKSLGRIAYAGEIDSTYYQFGLERVKSFLEQDDFLKIKETF